MPIAVKTDSVSRVPCLILVRLLSSIELHWNFLALAIPFASSHYIRFDQQSILSDLEEAIELHRAALALRPTGRSHRSMFLNSLANSLRVRFHQRGVISDLDEANEFHQAALVFHPPFILIDFHLSTTLPTVSEKDSNSGTFCLT